ncbi:LOW QUALITY PROTEIN: interferon-activable protein 202-like, partial [Cricetulus griseus]|uniref:LOW QUALITY PROTEIN: interferon-activable protein 202-like n=1 Tax=Cricetulus griseus TaxID=10029 RepID=UPI000454BDEA
NEPSEEDGLHEDTKQVMVLEATKAFTVSLQEIKKMFHATVVTVETEFFRVKVFEKNLQEMFTLKRFIVFLDYFGSYGSLVIHKASSVSEVTNIGSMEILRSLSKEGIPNPKIQIKWENCICYGIKDYTGQMKVAVSGHLTNVNCNIGDKVRLVCFELTSDVNEWFLRAVRYSYMEQGQSPKVLFYREISDLDLTANGLCCSVWQLKTYNHSLNKTMETTGD